ncbi:zinc ABC transporter ATP-binding protein AztA [soil metagenome]
MNAAAGSVGEAAVTLDNVSVTYHRHPAVHHVSGTFDTGSLTAIVGPNGAGKSSLLAAIASHVPLATGGVRFASRFKGKLAYLPQQSEIERAFPVKVIDVVMLGAWQGLGVFRSAGNAVRARAMSALDSVGLNGFESRLIGDLSVGQFQRVLFARLLLQDAQVILLDEPFNAIDARTTADLLRLARRWHDEGRTVIAVLHDMHQVQENFPRCLLLAREAVAWGATADVLTVENMHRARQMSERWDEHAPICEPMPAAAGLHQHSHEAHSHETHAHAREHTPDHRHAGHDADHRA